jgi:hypothetical protein
LPDEVPTVTQAVVVVVALPEVPVTVISYVPVVVVDVVLAVSVAACAVELLIVTDVGERLQVTGLEALDGEVVTAQVSATVPENEPDGVTVIVEVLPEVAPGLLTLIVPLFKRVKSLEPLASQKPLQPARSRGMNSASVPHFFHPIAAPSSGTHLSAKILSDAHASLHAHKQSVRFSDKDARGGDFAYERSERR